MGGAPPPSAHGSLPTDAIDCPDGLARCEEGSVEASRLAVIAQGCRGPESLCSCPWDRIAACERGCVADGVEVVIDRVMAAAQLCAPDGGPVVRLAAGRIPNAPRACAEGQLYRCVDGVVVDCLAHEAVAACIRGCFANEAFIDDASGSVTREAAFAILCSR